MKDIDFSPSKVQTSFGLTVILSHLSFRGCWEKGWKKENGIYERKKEEVTHTHFHIQGGRFNT